MACLQVKNELLSSVDSITWKQMFVHWENEFETVHECTVWDRKDYLEEIEKFARHKILKYVGLKG